METRFKSLPHTSNSREDKEPSASSEEQIESTEAHSDFDLMFSKYSCIKEKFFYKEVAKLVCCLGEVVDAKFTEVLGVSSSSPPSAFTDLMLKLKDDYKAQLQELVETMLSKKLNVELASFKEIKVRVDHQRLLLQRKVSEFVLLLSTGFKDRKPLVLNPSSNISNECFGDENAGNASFRDPNSTEDSWTAKAVRQNPYPNGHQPLPVQNSQLSKSKFSDYAKAVLDDWATLRKEDPYPTFEEKAVLSNVTGLSLQQINTWFVNFRIRKLRFNKNTRRHKFCSEIKKSLLAVPARKKTPH
jgi:Homeobox KN domain